jgi:hypothetical protein
MAGPSNFGGFPQGVTIKGVPISITNPGKVWWLSNATTLVKGDKGGSNANRGTFQAPFSTLAGAITVIAADGGANRGDILVVKPGHAETISSATALTVSVAGLAIVGMGAGSKRPKWTLDTATTAAINVSVDDVSFTNCQFVANFLSIATCFALTTAKNFTLQGCSFTDASGILDFLAVVTSTGAANTVDGLTVNDCQWYSLGTTSMGTMITSANDIDRLTLQRNFACQVSTVDAPIYAVTTAGVLTNLLATDNIGYRLNTATSNGSMINMGGTVANATGVIARNFIQTKTTSSDKLTPASTGLGFFENRVSGVTNATGFVIPAVDS